jgi:hypothetical protein
MPRHWVHFTGFSSAPPTAQSSVRIGIERSTVVALYAGANKCPRPRDLSRPGLLHCLVGDFVAEDLFFNLVDGLFIHGVDPLCRLFHGAPIFGNWYAEADAR